MSLLADQMLLPNSLDALLSRIERESNIVPLPLETAAGQEQLMMLICRIDATKALMEVVIKQQIAANPALLAAGTASLTTVAERMRALRQALAGKMPRAPTPKSFFDLGVMHQVVRIRAAMAALIEWVDRIPQMDLSVVEIDRQLADVIKPSIIDWGEYLNQALGIRHRAAYELLRLRAAVVEQEAHEIPELGRRILINNAARDALVAEGLTMHKASQLVVAIRHGDIPHVTIVDEPGHF